MSVTFFYTIVICLALVALRGNVYIYNKFMEYLGKFMEPGEKTDIETKQSITTITGKYI